MKFFSSSSGHGKAPAEPQKSESGYEVDNNGAELPDHTEPHPGAGADDE